MIGKTVLDYCKVLTDLGIENEIAEHPETKQISEVLNYLHLKFSDCVPTLIMKGDGCYHAIIIRGDCKIDFKKIKKALDINDLRFATPEEFTEFTGLPLGAARVYTPNAETLIDPKVLEKEYLFGGSGRFNCSIKYKTADLAKIAKSKIVDVTKDQTPSM